MKVSQAILEEIIGPSPVIYSGWLISLQKHFYGNSLFKNSKCFFSPICMFRTSTSH